MDERKRLECRNHGNCLWILEYMTSCDGHLPEWDGERHDCAEYEPMPDVKALLALADEFEEDACWEVQTQGDTSGAWRFKDACDRIREALGVEK